MKKALLGSVVILVIVGAVVWMLSSQRSLLSIRPSETGSMSAEGSPIDKTLSATGTVAAISADSITISLEGGISNSYAVKGDVQVIGLQSASPEPGMPVVIIYSKTQGKPLSAIVSEPFEVDSASSSIETISGKLISVKGNTVNISVDGKAAAYAFDSKNPLEIPSAVGIEGVHPGDSVSIEYVESADGPVVRSIVVR